MEHVLRQCLIALRLAERDRVSRHMAEAAKRMQGAGAPR
jgi:hypothetical protein